jgi:hypothetical protein
MQCPYCGAHYSLEKPCFCQPPVEAKSAQETAVKGPWGEAERGWSEPGESGHRVIEPSGH